MKSSSIGGVIVAAVVSAPANGEPPVENSPASTALDVEFWGRRQIRRPDPDGTGGDIINYGDPVAGKFRIWLDDAPAPNLTTDFKDAQDARVYGRRSSFQPSPASFVTSRWLSPLPAGISGDVSPLSGGVPDDYVIVGDAVRFRSTDPLTDWFTVTDKFTRSFQGAVDDHNQLFVTTSTPRDIIDGIGLKQQFDLVTPVESGDPGYGFFQETLRNGVRFIQFAVERLRVSKVRVCRR